MIVAPRITTARLSLRAHQRGDFLAYREAYASDRLRYMGAPINQFDAWAAFCRDVAQWSLVGHGAWAIDLTETGAFVGQVSLNGHPYFPEPELGWMVLASGEGKGIAAEAALAVRDWAFQSLRLSTLVSYIHRDNNRSIRLAERMGARCDSDAPPCPYPDHLVYRHPAPETTP